jgi:hypothetical protein
MVLDRVIFQCGTALKLISSCADTNFCAESHSLQAKFLQLARKLCKEGKSIDGRAFRREECTLLHKVINTCVEKFTGAKYLSLASERIVQRARELF